MEIIIMKHTIKKIQKSDPEKIKELEIGMIDVLNFDNYVKIIYN